jgi:CRP-like cAMP-binding protein
MADFLEEKVKEISARLKELKPAVEEYQRLEEAHRALTGLEDQAATPRRSTRRATRRSSSGNGRRGRPRGSGTRGTEALKIVRDKPGITIPEIAQRMGIQQNYLYRVLPGLEQDGLVRKDGRGWFPKNGS